MDATISEPWAEAPGNSAGEFLNLQNGCRNVRVIRPRCRYLHKGIIGTTGPNSGILIEDPCIDMGWYTKIPAFSGSGSSVTYTSAAITDTAASFTGITAGQSVIAEPVLASGTSTAIAETSLTDSAANFTGAGVTTGMIVTCGTAIGIVSAVTSATSLYVEEWLSATTRQIAQSPVTGTAYTVSGIRAGSISASTSITVSRWFDLNGNSVTPASGTPYVVLLNQPGYPVQDSPTCDHWKVVRPQIQRSYTDSINFNGNYDEIYGGLVKDGQDMGLTILGSYHRVRGLLAQHNGTSGLWSQATDSDIDMMCVDNGWAIANTGNTGEATELGSRNRITVKATRLSCAQDLFALVINGAYGGSGSTIDVAGYGHLTATLGGANTPGTVIIRSVAGTIDSSLPGYGIAWNNDDGLLGDMQPATGGPAGHLEVFSRDLINSGTMALSTGILRLTYFTARVTLTVNYINFASGSAALNGSQTLVQYGLYSVASSGNLALQASVANDTTIFAAASTEYPRAVSASCQLVKGGRYALAVLQVGGGSSATIPGLNYAAGDGPATIFSRPPALAGYLPGQASLPPSISSGSVQATGQRAYGEVY